MSSTPTHAPKILVTGATGNIGSALVRMLLADGLAVRALSRNRARAQELLGSVVEVVEGDLSKPESLRSAIEGCDRALFLATGGGLAEMAASFSAAAKGTGLKQIVAVSSGTVEMTPIPAIGVWHQAMEEALGASGIPTTFLRPDNFDSNSLMWAGMIKGTGKVFLYNPESQSTPIDPYDIAAVAHVCLTKSGYEGKALALSGPTVMTAREQVATIAREIWREIDVVELPKEQARAGMMQHGMPAVFADAILELMGREPRPTATVREVTGREPREYSVWVKENRGAFLGGTPG